MVSVPILTEASPPVTLASHHRYTGFMNRLEWICHPMNKSESDKRTIPKIINYKISKLAEIDRHEEFDAADFYM